MGRIVGAYATSHVLMSPEGVEEQAERVFTGMREIGRRVQNDRPDVIVLISSDHLMNFKLDVQVPLIVGVREEYVSFGDMGLPKKPFKGHRQFALDLLYAAAEAELDVARAEELCPDHGVVIPTSIINPGGRVPTVPVYINTAMTPIPSPKRAWRLGSAIRRAVEDLRPADERVVVVGAGGLSHWICTPEEGRVNEEFDAHVMDTICRGEGHRLAELTQEKILRDAGNGGLEILNWICMAGAVPQWRGEVVYYESIPAWMTGMGGVALQPRTDR